MASQTKTIKVYGQGGPNPPKVAMVLEELGLPYEAELIPFTELKQPAFVKINPNGRIPALYDPNTDLTIWESGAIILYLIDRYDTDNKLSFQRGTNDDYLTQQWLFYQVSGQGPYYGQSIYFQRYHSEPAPSTVERFNKEINRVTGVLEGWLAKQDKGDKGPWLVGGKFTYADLSFLNWQKGIASLLPKDQLDMDQYPYVRDWVAKIAARPGIKKILEENERLFKAHQAQTAKEAVNKEANGGH